MSLKVKKAGRFYTFLLVVILIAAAVLLYSKYLRVKEITVSGNEHVPAEQIIQMAGIDMHSSILSLDEERIISNLEADGRLVVGAVERIFPDKVCIHVKERIPVVQIKFSGGYLLLDGECVYMRSEKDKQALPVLTGVIPVTFTVGEVITVDQNLQGAMLSVVKALSACGQGMDILTLDVSDAKNLSMRVTPEYEIILGTNYKLNTKFQMAEAFVRECNSQGLSGGKIDVRDADNVKGYYSSPQPSVEPTVNPTPEPTVLPMPSQGIE